MWTRFKTWFKRYRYHLALLSGLAGLGYYFCLPQTLFERPYCTVVLDREGQLLGAKIAADGQWRFPPGDSLPDKFVQALILFEDKRFYSHWGLDPWALGRALRSNIQAGQTVSGGSTLSMQVIRLSRPGYSRSLANKLWESLLATRLEWRYSKAEILDLYCAHAPFGGNVVGLEAAAWKYFARPAQSLSWAEVALLAVLPNSPSRLHLAKNRELLQAKRDRLLDRLHEAGHLDSLSLDLAKLEPLPERPAALPAHAPHLLERLHREQGSQGQLRSSLRLELQARLNGMVNQHYQRLSKNGINNAAALVLDTYTGEVLAYVGNAPQATETQAKDVDMIPALRSSGSILKPLLYAAALQEGEILPQSLLPDVPSQFKGYTPKNYDGAYRGMVPADQVVSASLNVPSVHLLQRYGLLRFYQKLQDLGLTSLQRGPEHYGLTLILGGAETKLWDLAGIYASMGRCLLSFQEYDGLYPRQTYRPPHYLLNQTPPKLPREEADLLANVPLRASALWHTVNAMQEVARPGEEQAWKQFASSQRIAWKTGTSFGFRDAWAVGLSPRYTVAVWVGNADGEGRPGLVGVQAAAPLMFEIFQSLGQLGGWFRAPYDEMALQAVCRHSGHLAAADCPEQDTLWLTQSAQKAKLCPHHQAVFLDPSGQYRVHGDCESPARMQRQVYFVLSPAQALYYRRYKPNYQNLPPFRADCEAKAQGPRQMELIYPANNQTKIYLPRQLDESRNSCIFEAGHRRPKATIFWHINEVYIGSTTEFHQMGVNLPPGKYILSLVDELGELIERRFEIEAQVQ